MEKKPIRYFTKECVICGDHFETNNTSQNYCGAECRNLPHEPPPKYSWNKLKWSVLARDGFKCMYCGKGPDDGAKLQVDHIWPTSEGGGDDFFNLISSCHLCNAAKGGTLLMQKTIEKFWKRNIARCSGPKEYHALARKYREHAVTISERKTQGE